MEIELKKMMQNERERQRMTRWGLRILGGGAAVFLGAGMYLGSYLTEQSLQQKQQPLETALTALQHQVQNCGK
jgi:hypothetical protein